MAFGKDVGHVSLFDGTLKQHGVHARGLTIQPCEICNAPVFDPRNGGMSTPKQPTRFREGNVRCTLQTILLTILEEGVRKRVKRTRCT